MASPLAAPTVDLSALPAGASRFHLIKTSVEAALEKKVPSALTLREKPAAVCLPTGVAEVDALCGGIPRGALSEVTGTASSGRTSLLLSLLTQVTARQEFCALVDASAAFDPQSAETAGVELERVLWVKCSAGILSAVARASSPAQRRRDATATGTAALRPLDKALRVADLLLASGGFGLVALDLGDLPVEQARRVPLTTWFRLRRMVEGTPCALVVLEQAAHAKSCAEVVLRLESSDFRLQSSAGSSVVGPRPSAATILAGLEISAELVRGHAQKKCAAASGPARFSTRTAWAV
jgi:hypothetical protein